MHLSKKADSNGHPSALRFQHAPEHSSNRELPTANCDANGEPRTAKHELPTANGENRELELIEFRNPLPQTLDVLPQLRIDVFPLCAFVVSVLALGTR
jgi:hypothetical protein